MFGRLPASARFFVLNFSFNLSSFNITQGKSRYHEVVKKKSAIWWKKLKKKDYWVNILYDDATAYYANINHSIVYFML